MLGVDARQLAFKPLEVVEVRICRRVLEQPTQTMLQTEPRLASAPPSFDRGATLSRPCWSNCRPHQTLTGR